MIWTHFLSAIVGSLVTIATQSLMDAWRLRRRALKREEDARLTSAAITRTLR